MRPLRVVLFGVWMFPVLLAAQANAPTPCTAPPYRQLDFWIGEWEVVGPAGKVVGHNTIARAQGGCLVSERWRSVTGSDGESMNYFNPTTRTWHQVWVDNAGGVLMFTGTAATDEMVYRGETGRGDGAQRHRMTLRRQGDGTVRQLWETWPAADTSEAAKTVSFDGTYRRVR